MMPSPDNLSIIIGASPKVDSLRRLLRQNGFANLGVATSLRGLRRELIAGEDALIVSCILLDEPSIMERGEPLRHLLLDAKGFTSDFLSIGLVTDPALMPEAMKLGCHFYLDDLDRIAPSIRALSGHWQSNRHEADSDVWNQKSPARHDSVAFPNRLNSLSSSASPSKILAPADFGQPPINRIRGWFEPDQSDPDRP